MPADNDQDGPARRLAAEVQRTAEGELLAGQADDATAVLGGDLERPVGRPGVDDQYFDQGLRVFLLLDPLENRAEVTSLVQRADDDEQAGFMSGR